MFTEARVDNRVGPDDDGVIEVGPQGLESVPATSIVVFEQVRKTMDREALEELKDSIVARDLNGRVVFNLLNPLIVADLNAEHAAAYVGDLNKFWHTDTSLESLEPNPITGRYNFLIAGHRRLQAVFLGAAENDVPPEWLRIATSMRPNISFQEALIIQMQENTYAAPSPIELAEAIRLSYDFLKSQNPLLTQRQCAAILRCSPSRVSRALAYSDLPATIKDWVKEGHISFNLAVILGRIQDEYRLRFNRTKEDGLLAAADRFEDAPQYAAYEIETFGYTLFGLMQRSRRNSATALERAQGQLDMLRQQRQYEQQAFVLQMELETARSRRRRAVSDLARFAWGGFMAAVHADESVLEAAFSSHPEARQMFEAALDRFNKTGSDAPVQIQGEAF